MEHVCKQVGAAVRLSVLLLCLFVLFSSCTSEKKRLYVYSWADFFAPEVLDQFEKRYNCTVIVDTFDSNETMYAKLRLGSKGYDIVIPSSYYLEIMKRHKMLEQVDYTKIPLFYHFDRRILQRLAKELLEYGVPYSFTFTGIAWRKDKVGDIEPSWALFGEHAYKGRMTLLNDPREVLGAGLQFLGYSINTTNPEEIERAKTQVLEWKKNIAKFESEQYKSGLASGEYLIAQSYQSDALQLMRENSRIAFGLAKEGSWFASDFLVIPKGAQNSDLAYEFINYLYDPQIAAKNMEHTAGFFPNTAAYQLVSPLIQNHILPLIDSETFSSCQYVQDVGKDVVLYNAAWQEIKSHK
jgi:spermidine/putrescine transport system substrate-binding protein